jgi:hypothetical protein
MEHMFDTPADLRGLDDDALVELVGGLERARRAGQSPFPTLNRPRDRLSGDSARRR